MSACRSAACHRNNSRNSCVSDVSARIPARMSVSVSAPRGRWNSSFSDTVSKVCGSESGRRTVESGGGGARPRRPVELATVSVRRVITWIAVFLLHTHSILAAAAAVHACNKQHGTSVQCLSSLPILNTATRSEETS